jgi:hypothetical protein
MTSSRSTAASETARELAHRWVNGDLSGRYSCVERSMDRHSYECDLVMGAIVARDAETAAIKVALRNAEALLAQVHDIPWGDGGGGERFCVVCNFAHREEGYEARGRSAGSTRASRRPRPPLGYSVRRAASTTSPSGRAES